MGDAQQSLHEKRAAEETQVAQSVASTLDRANVLRYSVVRQLLWGEIGGRKYGPIKAWSGAGQDGVKARNVKYSDWNPARQADEDEGVRGGAIVPGWWIVLPEKLAAKQRSSYLSWGGAPTGQSLRVVPYQLDPRYADGVRNSFYIHGTGGKGSDGCLLVAPTHRHALVDWVCGTTGAWLHAYVSGIELNEAFEQSTRMAHTA